MHAEKRVLIVCYTSAGQMYLGVLLKRIWYSPTLAKTVEEAVVLARQDRFDLIILDGDRAERDLLKSISLLRNDAGVRDLPLIVLTAEDNAEKNEALLGQGCTAILSKPLDLAIVYGVLGRLTCEPRNAPRIPVKFRVKIEEAVPEKELTCINLSEGGMYLRTYSPLQEGMVVHVAFSLPHDSTILKLEAQVVRTASLGTQMEVEPGMGLRFFNMPEELKTLIRNFVQWEMVGDLTWEPDL